MNVRECVETRGDLDLEVRIDKLQDQLNEYERLVDKYYEENGNLQVIISKLQEEKLELRKQLDQLLHERNVRDYEIR